ncbi:unnamed protein product [Linum tenue]|uniref:Uncharacterized protein n=1 Tax=Linum tenue TaxID=586396 RepID=A0AAV0MR09_9ROSI|nr:unnamed protein product [Linum tenue]
MTLLMVEVMDPVLELMMMLRRRKALFMRKI